MLQIVPSIDLRGGKVVRLEQGDYARQLNYDLTPVAAAQSFELAGAQWMHIVDLDGAKAGAVLQLKLIAGVIAQSKLRIQVGGGVRSSDDVMNLLELGAARVVVGTHALENWQWFKNLAHSPACADRLVLALDARDGVVATRGWTHTSGKRAVDLAGEVSDWPLAGLLYTDVAKDGMLTGPNFEQTRQLADATSVPVIASGGVGSLEHIRQLTRLSIWGVILGRSLHDGRVDLHEALGLARK